VRSELVSRVRFARQQLTDLVALAQVLTDSNLSILGDMVKSLSKRAIKQQSVCDQLNAELTQCKENCQASWTLITDVAQRVEPLETAVREGATSGKKGKRR
jgi:hypothetical protein